MALGGELGHGARSVVYRWGRDDVVKIPRPATPPSWLRQELRLARAASGAGAPTPGGWRLVDVDGREGLVSRRVDGPSMWHALENDPDRAEELACELARIQCRVFACRTSYAFPTQRDRVTSKIRQAARSHDVRLLAALDLVPPPGPSPTLCHGDLHPRNVVLADGGPMLVDWFDACRGDAAADVARTSILLSEPAAIADTLSGPLRSAIARFHAEYLRSVAALVGLGPAQIDPWRTAQRVARLAEGFGQADVAALAEEVAQAADLS